MRIRIKQFDRPLSNDDVRILARFFPVIYVFSRWEGLANELNRSLITTEDGEIVVIGEFDQSGEFCAKFGWTSPETMCSIVIHVPYNGASEPMEYSEVFVRSRKFRARNANSERRWFSNKPWLSFIDTFA